MTVAECYDRIGEDYAAVVERFGGESMVQYFCTKFLRDRSFAELTAAIHSQDAETAFRSAHTLKGVCLNLGFGKLGKAASDLTEYLRGRTAVEGCDDLYAAVALEYRRVADALNQL